MKNCADCTYRYMCYIGSRIEAQCGVVVITAQAPTESKLAEEASDEQIPTVLQMPAKPKWNMQEGQQAKYWHAPNIRSM